MGMWVYRKVAFVCLPSINFEKLIFKTDRVYFPKSSPSLHFPISQSFPLFFCWNVHIFVYFLVVYIEE